MFFSKYPPVTKNNKLSFNARPQQDIESVSENIQSKEACVVWYFGTSGLKQGTVDYYKPLLTTCLLKNATPFLVDLTAWNAFKNNRCKITGSSSHAKQIQSDKISVLKASDVFDALRKIQPDSEAFKLIEDIVQRKNLLEPSMSFEKTGITLGDIFGNQCPAIASLYSLDCANSYSIIQYLEFLFLVESILKTKPETTKIKFILPNDEAKYYASTMEEDLHTFLNVRSIVFKKVDISIEAFNYSNQMQHRPYNAPTKIAPKKLSANDIVDTVLLEKNKDTEAEALKTSSLQFS